MTRLLFLDVDGVLNAHEFDPEVMCGPIHRNKMELLNRVLRATDARIVLSSAWRYIIYRGEANLAGMDWLFRSHGMPANRLIGITREDTMIRPPWDGSQPWPLSNERGQQIADWLVAHKPHGNYVVLDDLDPGISAAGHPFVRTDGRVGLTEADADRAIALLMSGGVPPS